MHSFHDNVERLTIFTTKYWDTELGNDRNVTNRQFNNHCLGYEQNAWKKAFWAVEWSWSVLSTVTNTSSNFEVKPLRSAATRATSSIVSNSLQNLNVGVTPPCVIYVRNVHEDCLAAEISSSVLQLVRP